MNRAFSLLTLLFLSSCQMGYLIKSAYNQLDLISSRQPIEKALQDPLLSAEEKRKLELSLEVRQFAEKELQLNVKKNYSTFVKLDRPYVSYVVSASPKWKLESFQWSFPFVGKMPYKGFFNENEALEEDKEMKEKNYDTYVRGVSAYSTLGWFSDPLLSSMLSSSDHDLVNTIIHESVHATLYIKNAAAFNERLATFLGNKGMERFYLQKEGEKSSTLAKVRDENFDDQAFSTFMSRELDTLEKWYQTLPESERKEELRESRFQKIRENFDSELLPQLKTDGWKKFSNAKLNNARLVVFKTYFQDHADFEKLWQKTGKDFVSFMKECRQLEEHKNPEQGLKELIK